MPRLRLFPLALLALGHAVSAQQVPNSGGQLLQIPPSPAPQRVAPQISIVPSGAAPSGGAADGTRITVQRLRISGATVYSESELLAMTGFTAGSELSLSDLRAMAARIGERYRRDGYILAQAYVPAQSIDDGGVTIEVLEGRYGKIELRNTSRLGDGLVDAELAGLDRGAPVAIGPLESRLLLLSDISGVRISSTLVPGVTPGASDLIVDVVPGQLVTGSVDADNAGNRYTGVYRAGATVNLNNPTGHGDVGSVRVLTAGEGLNYGRASYQTRIGRATVGVAYSRLYYEIGREFKSLDASGNAGIASVYASVPLMRSRAGNLYAQVGFDAKTFRDRIGSVPALLNKRAQVVTASLRGDRVDEFGFGRGGATTTFWVSASAGNIDIRTEAARADDAATARSNGHFGKLAFNVARLQAVTDSVSLYGSLNGQIASKNLDASEKMELGGVNAVRGYPEGEAFADEGYVMTFEARWNMPPLWPNQPGQLQPVAFFDTGRVKVNENPWGAGLNHRTLSAAGLGLNWSGYENVVVRMVYARRIGNDPARSAPDRSGRFWVQLVKYF